MTHTNQPIPILYVHYGQDWIRGSERCLLDLLSHLDRDQFTPIVWCNSATLATHVAALDIDVSKQDFPLLLGWLSPKFDLSGFSALINQGLSLVQYHQIKIIHSNSGAPCQWLNIVARKANIPLVAHLHCRYPLRDRISLGLHHVSHLVGVSQPVVEQYLEDGINPDRVSVIANGIDPIRLNNNERLDIRQHLGLEPEDLILMSVGSLIERKGMDTLISALALVRQAGIPAKLIIVGDGPFRQQLTQQVDALTLDQQVFFLGERGDVPALLQSGVDVFLSGAKEEVFGLVLAEAGLHGIPVIAPDVGGISSVVKHQHSGLLVAAPVPQQIAQAIEFMFYRPDLRQQFGQAAQQRVSRLFLISQHVQTMQQRYLTLLNNPAHALTWSSHYSIKAIINASFQFIAKAIGLTLGVKRKEL